MYYYSLKLELYCYTDYAGVGRMSQD